MVLDSDIRILVAGSSLRPGHDFDLAVCRLL